MDNENLPLWKRMALEKGISLEDEERGHDEKSNDGKGKKEEAPSSTRQYTTIRVFSDSLPMLRQYASFAGLNDVRNYAQMFDALLRDRIEKYKEVLDLLSKL